MAIYSKRYYWGHKKYNNKTGLYKGEHTYSSDGTVRDWKDRYVRTDPPGKMGKNGYD